MQRLINYVDYIKTVNYILTDCGKIIESRGAIVRVCCKKIVRAVEKSFDGAHLRGK